MLNRLGAAAIAVSLVFPAHAAPIASRAMAPVVVSAPSRPIAGFPLLLSAPRLAAVSAPILGGTLPMLTPLAMIQPSVPQRVGNALPVLEQIVSGKKKKMRPALTALQTLTRKTAKSAGSSARAPLTLFFDLSRPHQNSLTVSPARVSRAANRLFARPAHNVNAASTDSPPSPKQPLLRGWGSQGWLYIAYLSLVQAGIGAYAPVFPEMAIQRYGGAAYGLAASLAVLAMPVAAIGAKKLATKFSAKGGLALALVGASATSAALFVLFGANALPWLGLVAGLTAVQGSFAVMRTLDKVIPGQLYGEDSLKIKRFNGLSFAVSRLPGILIPLAIGSILAAVGQYGALAIFSLAMLAAAPLVKLIKTNSPARNAEEPTTGTGDPELLRLSGWGFASQQIMTYVLPFILVSAYGRYAGGGDPAAAKAIGGMLFSFWTVGLLGGTIALIRSARRANPVTSMRRAAFIGAFGLFGFIPLLFSTPIPAYIGIAAAGFTNAYSFLSYLSTAQANASEDNRAGTIARYMMFSFLVVAAAVWGLGTLIQYYPADAVPFAALLSGLGGLSLLNLWIAAKLRGRES